MGPHIVEQNGICCANVDQHKHVNSAKCMHTDAWHLFAHYTIQLHAGWWFVSTVRFSFHIAICLRGNIDTHSRVWWIFFLTMQLGVFFKAICGMRCVCVHVLSNAFFQGWCLFVIHVSNPHIEHAWMFLIAHIDSHMFPIKYREIYI